MDTITLTLKHDTIQGIICILENHLHNLYTKAEKYKGHSREKSIINYIKKCTNCLSELESFMPKDNCEQEAKE